jgi:hypothetical protein
MNRFVALIAVSSLVGALAPAHAQDGGGKPSGVQAAATDAACASFTWDVSHELEVLSQPAISLNAGSDTKNIAHIDLDKRYAVKLVPQGNVKFVAKVGKPALDDGAQGGLVSFRTQKAGRYRVSITTGHWLDVVDGQNLVVSRDFQGQRGCEKVHKIVEFELTNDHDFVLQLSGGTAPNVGIAVTRVKSTG